MIPSIPSNTMSEQTTSDDKELLSERDIIVFKAQMCEKACRFEEMVELMGELCRKHDCLNVEERNLLSCAYKNVIGSRRTAHKILTETFNASLILSQEDETIIDNKYKPALIKCILNKIESELKKYCIEILSILTERLILSVTTTGESRVFYYKMKGDYTRYLCETCIGTERKEKANESLVAYRTAYDRAMIELPPTHPVRLGLMLNFSVFYHEIMKSPERSCRIAKQAFDDAIAELDTLSEESYRDSTIIMQLLRDNLNLWESEQLVQPTSEQAQPQQLFPFNAK